VQKINLVTPYIQLADGVMKNTQNSKFCNEITELYYHPAKLIIDRGEF
jgi:hypothetical protein